MPTETLTITTEAGEAEAHLSRPDGGRHPGVLLFMDALGLRDRIREMADRIAGWGFVVLAPNVFHREGSAADLAPTTDLRQPENRAAFMESAKPRVGRYTPDLAEADIPAWFGALASHADAPFGVVGYCMGAPLAVRAAALEPRVAAVAGFHGGRLATDDPSSPHLLVSRTHAEYVFGHADEDPSNPAEAIDRLGSALREAGLVASNAVYPGAPHGFAMADSSTYDAEAESRHWRDLEGLFRRALAG